MHAGRIKVKAKVTSRVLIKRVFDTALRSIVYDQTKIKILLLHISFTHIFLGFDTASLLILIYVFSDLFAFIKR